MFLFVCAPSQVSQLYDVVQKWDAMATSLPQVVQRLIAVKELHEQGTSPPPPPPPLPAALLPNPPQLSESLSPCSRFALELLRLCCSSRPLFQSRFDTSQHSEFAFSESHTLKLVELDGRFSALNTDLSRTLLEVLCVPRQLDCTVYLRNI